MLSVFRVATPVTTLKLSHPSHQLSPYSPLCKRATFAVVISDASNSPAGQATPSDPPPLVVISPIQRVKPLTTNAQRPPFLTRPLRICDINSDTRDDGTANPDTHLAPTVHHPSSSFPVHGPFDLLYCIQNGGFGSAWAAKDRGTGRLLCLKVFQSLKDPNVTRSVKTELRMFRRMVKSKEGERGKQFIIELNRSIQHGTAVLFAMVGHRRLPAIHPTQCQLQELMATDLSMYLATDPERCKVNARQWMAQMVCLLSTLQ